MNIGDRFGALVLTARVPGRHGHKIVCTCDCGTVKTYWTRNVKSGWVRSCGCAMPPPAQVTPQCLLAYFWKTAHVERADASV